jgi:hypothetical protein
VGGHVIDHVVHIRDVVGPAFLDGNIPASVHRVERRDDEALLRGDIFEPAVPGLARRRSAAAVEIQYQRQALMSVISGRNKQTVCTRTTSGRQLLG